METNEEKDCLIEAVSRLDKIKIYIDLLNKEFKDLVYASHRLAEIDRKEIYAIHIDILKDRLNMKIEDSDFDLSIRTSSILNRLKITTLKQLAVLSDLEILQLKPKDAKVGFGRKSLKELKNLLKRHGLVNDLRDFLKRKEFD